MSTSNPPTKAATMPSSTPNMIVATTATTMTRSAVAPAIGISGNTVVSSRAAMSADRAAKGMVKVNSLW